MLQGILGALVALYGACTGLYVLLHYSIGERLNPVALLNNFMPLLILPALPLALLCVLFRRWRLAALLLPASLMFAVLYGPFFTPARARAGESTATLKLLTHNLHSETELLAPMVDVIRVADADIVALQELSPEAANAFVEALGERYPYRAMHPDPNAHVRGQGVLSRYPIVEDSYWVNGMGQQRVVLDVNGARLTVYNVHPPHPFKGLREGAYVDTRVRDAITGDILRRAANDPAPIILAGDFNMTDQTDIYNRVAAQYHDTYREIGWGLGFTFPDMTSANLASARLSRIRVPLARIDYVFHDDSITAVDARVWPTAGGSDHRPVLVELALPR